MKKSMVTKFSVSIENNLAKYAKSEAITSKTTVSQIITDALRAHKQMKVIEAYQQIAAMKQKLPIPEDAQFEAIKKLGR